MRIPPPPSPQGHRLQGLVLGEHAVATRPKAPSRRIPSTPLPPHPQTPRCSPASATRRGQARAAAAATQADAGDSSRADPDTNASGSQASQPAKSARELRRQRSVSNDASSAGPPASSEPAATPAPAKPAALERARQRRMARQAAAAPGAAPAAAAPASDERVSAAQPNDQAKGAAEPAAAPSSAERVSSAGRRMRFGRKSREDAGSPEALADAPADAGQPDAAGTAAPCWLRPPPQARAGGANILAAVGAARPAGGLVPQGEREDQEELLPFDRSCFRDGDAGPSSSMAR